jgi:glyoxylate/hydroxypyruvate reductase A
MALLLDVQAPDWMTDEALRDFLRPLLPGVDIRCAPELGAASEIDMLACVKLAPGLARALPSLRLVQKLGAGVDAILGDPELGAGVRVARLRPETAAREIAEYCLAYVLREQRNQRFHAARQGARVWEARPSRSAPETAVGVLGLGQIGGHVARAFAALGFRVLGWSRSPKAIEGVDCRHGPAALAPLLGICDYAISVLPSTAATRGLFDAGILAAMKPGAWLVNVGRGDLIVEADLVAALDSGPLAGAVLDVFREEPLPSAHPFWGHPKITITPHVSGWRLTGGLEDVAENYRRLQDGRPLLHEVDRDAGY